MPLQQRHRRLSLNPAAYSRCPSHLSPAHPRIPKQRLKVWNHSLAALHQRSYRLLSDACRARQRDCTGKNTQRADSEPWRRTHLIWSVEAKGVMGFTVVESMRIHAACLSAPWEPRFGGKRDIAMPALHRYSAGA